MCELAFSVKFGARAKPNQIENVLEKIIEIEGVEEAYMLYESTISLPKSRPITPKNFEK